MAIVLKGLIKGKEDLEMDSNTIIGIIGEINFDLIQHLKKDNIFLMSKGNDFSKEIVFEEMKQSFDLDDDSFQKLYQPLFEELDLKESFCEKKIEDLSDSEIKILKYIKCFLSNKSIIVIDEPFLDLDYAWKKKIVNMINNLYRNTNKTIIVCSDNSNIIYLLCKKVLLVKNDEYYYGDINQVFESKDLLRKFNINEPDIVKFVNLAHEKKVNLEYVKDIRDLIKEVYKSV